MNIILYHAGHIILGWLALKISAAKENNFSVLEKLLIFSVALIPLGKLIYLPIPGMYGLKFSFIFGSVLAFFWFMYVGVKKRTWLLFITLFFPILSLIYIQNYDWILLYQLSVDQKDSSLLRLFSYIGLLLYCATIYTAILKNKNIYIRFADYYVIGTVLASIVGVYIFYFVLNGTYTSIDLEPVSAGVHVVNMSNVSIYRFNPGANVNEFSMILAYAIFLLPFTSFSTKTKILLVVIFLLLEFATLTRASWLALLLASFISLFFLSNLRRNLAYVFWASLVFIFIFSIVYHSSEQVRILFETRTSFDVGASGVERLEKFSNVFLSISDSMFRILFGFGWSTNMYVHNVYLQLWYEIGLFGLVVFIVSLTLFIKNVFYIHKGVWKSALIACIVFLAFVSLMHHTFYHMQTWFILAFVAGLSTNLRYLNRGSECH